VAYNYVIDMGKCQLTSV